jgi:hypothetical protein
MGLLIRIYRRVVLLGTAILSTAILGWQLLNGESLSWEILGVAALGGLFLGGAINLVALLSWVIMRAAVRRWVIPRRAILRCADLSGANLRRVILGMVPLDTDTTLPDGTKWTPDTDMARFTNPDRPDFWRSDDPKSPAYRGEGGD